jgi:hypothetical protein
MSDADHERARKFVDDKHLGYEASKAFEEWLKRREARAIRAEQDRKRREQGQ